jgi:hypothetical protein
VKISATTVSWAATLPSGSSLGSASSSGRRGAGAEPRFFFCRDLSESMSSRMEEVGMKRLAEPASCCSRRTQCRRSGMWRVEGTSLASPRMISTSG